MEDAPEDHYPSTDPAQAFEDLRAEVSVMRRAVEALPGAWEENRPPDYSPDLGRIAKDLAVVAGRLENKGEIVHPASSSTRARRRGARPLAVRRRPDWDRARRARMAGARHRARSADRSPAVPSCPARRP